MSGTSSTTAAPRPRRQHLVHDGTVLAAHDDEETFSLTEQQRDFLKESIGQVERGEWVDGWKLLDDLKA